MGIIIEIVLTVFAWRNGWKWRSLIPLGVVTFIIFFIGFGVGLSGGDSSLVPSFAILDLAAIIALIIMIVKKPKSLEQNTPPTPKV